jgi:hypothetical protein
MPEVLNDEADRRDPIYRKRAFDADIIELCVRWYIIYRLSYRHPVEMMAERGTISTDQPAALPMTTAAIGACPAATQPLTLPAMSANSPSAALTGLPKRLTMDETAAAKAAAQAALPRALVQGIVGSPIQVAEVPLDRVAAYDRIRSVSSQVRPLSGLIVPIRFADGSYAGVFLKAAGSRYIAVGLGEPNQTRLVAAAQESAAKRHEVAAESLALLRIPRLFLSFIARQSGGRPPIDFHPG